VAGIGVVIAARESVREGLRTAFEAAGIRIEAEASDIDEALDAVAARRPQLCVLDRELPGAGVTAVAALASPCRRPKLLLIGGAPDPVEARAATLAGASRCLQGSIDPEGIAAALAELAAEL
jgi:DNA-binding NarL/FixJ family response regulator